MLPVTGWKVYCADGSVHTSNPEAIPSNVQVVIYYHESPFRTLAYGDDTYDVDGYILFGAWMVDAEYKTMLGAALVDFEFPK